ncbi:hypothetical protein PsYK624_089980 [Phanerochaete sordida]|uniref:Uncharacterized protein n=1 Tax=Phanerochaete sordida TaxID=48140 RepID=A0A9P3GDN3_9APHY|nr:hypothetical protein PsYK624_089980 [Phanerochaete sordida]
MAGTVVQLFLGCCWRRRLNSVGEPDEHTRLIRPAPENEVPSPTPNYVVDQQIIRDRLGSIVRSKEGKMVNVNTPLPFNLHNKLDVDPSNPRPARSRSAHPVMGGLPESSTDMLPELPSRVSSYSPTRGRDLSPSHTSRSTTSLHPGDASYLPPEAYPDDSSRRPILNMRLVRGPGGYGVGGKFGPRKGRSATRSRVGTAEPDAPQHGGKSTSANAVSSASEDDVGQSSQESTPDLSGNDGAHPIPAEVALPDVGKITCSWGD